MKVLIFSHEYPNFGGGAGVVAKQLVTDLSNQGVVVDILTRARKNNDLSDVNHCFEVDYKGKPWFIAYTAYIKLCINLSSYDFIICNDNVSQYIAGLIFTKKELEKSVLLLHGSEPEYFYQNKSIKAKLLCLEKVYNRAITHCSKCIAHSYYMKDKFLEHTTSKVKKEKILVFYFGFDSDLFYPVDASNLRTSLDLKLSDIVLLTVGRVVEKKGFIRKLTLFNQARKSNSNLKWVIVGGGPFSAELKQRVFSLSLNDDIKFADEINRSDLKQYYSLANVFWLLSEFKESFGLVYIESQSCGTPAIGNNLYGVKEAINNKTGLLANSDSDVLDYISNGDYDSHIKNDLIEFSTRFHSKNFAMYLIENYK
ncbi:glycosyltransferase family 4 protein [Pseudoalteromonas sp. SA25]|uniref:glycosyltransferase family 4 protein n=1 Tax=Pseudoalteromonas sp. SA25 TaxID=2686347 RepID=UPI0013FDF2D4|nr:glycosyltransferase family 4 protein [Pseudoalteromonas sp. SA25]